jgi:DNA mismatch repair protein MutL
MPLISLLPDVVIDQIAAGEVLENPASAVKELIENALDAQAQDIRVEIEGGGLLRLLVEDDGCGMDSADAALSLRRHATSKIHAVEDLQKLETMGFRGEALAALASVSKLEIKTSNGKQGTKIVSQGGEITQIEVCARNKGTTIEAKDLFFNTPARLKFQKASSSCAAAVLKSVETIAIAHPRVRFALYSNGKVTFQSHPTDWKKRAEEILGTFAHEVSVSGLQGLLGRPEEGKLNRSGQLLFVNRRPIFSPLVARAVKQGFGTRMEERLLPSFLLFMEIPSDAVDVNVHPQKREVRFRDESKVFTWVRNAVEKALEAQPAPPPSFPWDFTPLLSQEEPFSFIANDAPAQLHTPYFSFSKRSKPLALLGKFLLVEQPEGWTLLDVKGAEARLLFEAMQTPKPDVQPLLCPFEWALSPTDVPEEFINLLKNISIEARVIGKKNLAIDALPTGLEISDLPLFLRELSSERKLAAAITKTCLASRRPISFEAASRIWSELEKCENKNYDPLGRKIQIPVTETFLKELFR